MVPSVNFDCSKELLPFFRLCASTNITENNKANTMVSFFICGLVFNLIIRYIKEIYPAPDLDEGKFFKNYESTRNLELVIKDMISSLIVLRTAKGQYIRRIYHDSKSR